MSKVVDERVVSMQFDNKQFESNVQTSMSTLEKLKQSLNLKGASKGLEEVSSAAKNVDLSPLSTGVETVRTKFSALEVMAVTALANITNSAVNAGKRIVSALTIDPIKTGFQEYETQINAVQTILANTKHKGSTLEDVNTALDELNKYADQTIYNFTEMTRNIGTFTAAGVDLDKSVTSIKGIANLAAVSGSNAQQASTAMYQLSQALAAGRVSLMDWNSVVNAGMGGQLFQDALKRTAEHMGYNVDALIKKYGSFRESLTQGEWLTSEVLTETLTQLSGAYTEADLLAQGYTEKQAKEIVDLANTAVSAATEVKTFSGVIDTVKESLQSGWAQTWEIIFGDFEEAKSLFTGISNALGGLVVKSAESRNAVLQGWKDLGGRTALVDSLKNAFEGLGSIVKPISEAFREIFPPITAKQLYNFSVGLKNLTENLKISDETASKLKSTFKGVFSVLDIFLEVIKAIGKGAFDIIGSLTGLSGGLLGISGAIGDGISGFRDYVKETDLFGTAVEKVTGFITKAITKVKEFGSSLKDGLNTSNFEGFLGFFEDLWNIVKSVGSGITKAMSSITNGITEAFGGSNFFEVLNNGLFAGVLIYITKFIKGLSNPFEEVGGILENVTGMLDDVRGYFEAYQNQLKAGTLLKIASAIAILAASIFVISTIDGEALAKSLGAITVLFAELMGSLMLFSKMDLAFAGTAKTIFMMLGMSTAILILSAALKNISSVDWNGLAKGLVGVGVLMAEIAAFLFVANKISGKITGTATGIVILSSAMLILAEAVKNFGSMNLSEIGKGLTSIGILLTELTVFTKLTGNSKNVFSTGAAMVLLGSSMKIFASAVKDFGSMNLSEIGKGLLAMGGALAEVAIAMRVMPKNMISTGTGLVIVGAAMKVLANALADFGGMSWTEIGKGLAVMGGSLAELAIALKLMNGTLAGSAALIIAAGALAILAPVMKTLGGLSWTAIAKGLITLAGAFTIVGVAGALLSPLIPSILGLAGAFALFGVSIVGIGAGLTLIGAGLTAIAGGFIALSASLAGGTTAIVAGLGSIVLGFAELIPEIAIKLAEGVVEFAKVIGECAPQLADSLLKMISEVMKSLATYTPQIVDSLLLFFIGVINSLADHLPELIKAAMNFIGKFFEGVIDALKNIDPDSLLKGVIAVGIMTALMYALSGVVGLIPSAMLGVLGLGVVVTELGLVLAAIGGLAQIPGLEWLVKEGGDFLEAIGTAIGQFVGGIAGGFMKGVSSSFPKIASDLSAFMTNIQPFIKGAKSIDSSVLDGILTLAEAILVLTAVDVIDGIASWLTGGSSMSDFAEQLVPFGKAMKKYSKEVSGIDSKAVKSSATAAKSLSELANNLPNSGGLAGLFAGENDLDKFAEQLVPFGKGMKAYSDAVSGINTDAVTSSATAAKSLSELANNLPNSGGLVSLFTGDNNLITFAWQLAPFGRAMKAYSDSVSGMDTAAVESSATAGKALSELANNLPNSGGLVSLFTGDNSLATFGYQLIPFGNAMKAYSDAIADIDPETITASTTAAKSLSELASNLPNSGGLVFLFTGDNDLATFGYQLVPFGRGMKEYSEAISGIDSEAIVSSSNAAQALSELASNLPNSGGLVSWFTGDNDLSSFGYKLVPFGMGMKSYAESISGIDSEAIVSSANAAKSLSELAANLPNSGGLVSWFTGDNDLSSFGFKLVPFGMGMKSYAESIAGIDSTAIESSASAAKALSELANNLPNSGGLVSLFTGDNDISSFGYKLVPFGKGMKQYSESVVGIDAEAIKNSASAAKALGEVTNSLSKTGGLVSLFTGEVDISSFGSKLVPFGKGMKQYSEAVVGLNAIAISNSVSAAKSLMEVANSLSKTGGLKQLFSGSSDISKFGKQLVPFGKGMKQYSEAVVGIDVTAISSSVTAAKKLVSVVNSISSSNTKGVTSFVTAINTLGNASVDKFIKAFSGASSKLSSTGANMVDSLIKGIKSRQSSLTAAASNLTTVLTKTVSSKTSTLNNVGAALSDGLVKGIKSKQSTFTSTATSLIGKFISGINSQKSKISSAMTSALGTAVNSARGYYNKFYSAGSYLVSGFANGISANTYKATAKARVMASAAATAASAALKIKSPSRVFYGIGDYAGIGFVNALADNVRNAYKAGSEMAISARNGLSSAISKISDIINGDVDAQPTIRPVLDLSDVKSGTKTINDLFGQKATIGTISNVNAISSMMNRNNQNGETSEIVSAINKLRKDLGNIGTTSYNVNGVTYDDGSNISEAVRTLIRAARVERRI